MRVPDSIKEMGELVGQVVTSSKSAAGNWLMPSLMAISKGRAEISVAVRDEMCNPFGNIHGGMMALVVDESIGWAVKSLESSQRYTSVSLNLDFLYAAAKGERIIAKAHVVRHGKKIINVAVAVYNEQEVLLCTASSNLVVTSMQPV